jgi:hypothetical protein
MNSDLWLQDENEEDDEEQEEQPEDEDEEEEEEPWQVLSRTLPHMREAWGDFRNMRFEGFSFGSIRIDGISYEYDVVIDHGKVRKRKKKPSKKFRESFGHTPLSLEEDIPWKCRRLVVGTGTGALPVMKELEVEAARRKVELLVLPTAQAIEVLNKSPRRTNAVLHVTC